MVDVKIPFNLYDIWAGIFPGMFLILILAMENFNLDFASIDFLAASFFVFAAYLVGQLIQGLGRVFRIFSYYFIRLSAWICRKLDKKLPGGLRLERYSSEQFLKKGSGWFSEEFRKRLEESICSRFKVSHKIREIEKFDLCYRYVAQKGFGERAERFLSLYAFHRGMVMSSMLAIAGSIISLSVLKTSIMGATNTAIISIFLAISAIIFFRRSVSFDRKFAQEIYEQFYVASDANK